MYNIIRTPMSASEVDLPRKNSADVYTNLYTLSGIKDKREFGFYLDRILDGRPELAELITELFVLAKLYYSEECPNFVEQDRIELEKMKKAQEILLAKQETKKKKIEILLAKQETKKKVILKTAKDQFDNRVKLFNKIKENNHKITRNQLSAEEKETLVYLINGEFVKKTFFLSNLYVNPKCTNKIGWLDIIEKHNHRYKNLNLMVEDSNNMFDSVTYSEIERYWRDAMQEYISELGEDNE